jgi:hypothetical protein
MGRVIQGRNSIDELIVSVACLSSFLEAAMNNIELSGISL